MKLNVLNLQDKNNQQLTDLINASGGTVNSFYNWVHKTRATARSMIKKIQKIEDGAFYASYSPEVKLELRNKKKLAVTSFDACELIMSTLGYVPPQRVFLTKDSIEQMFADACKAETISALAEHAETLE